MNRLGVNTGSGHANYSLNTEVSSSQAIQHTDSGRAGEALQSGLLPADNRYSAQQLPSTPEHARVTKFLFGSHGSELSNPATSQFERQFAGREHPNLSSLTALANSPASYLKKTLRSEPESDHPQIIPKRLQQKLDAIDFSKLLQLNADLYKYASLASKKIQAGKGPDRKITAQDIKHLPLLAKMENARNPGLNLHICKNGPECFQAIRDQQQITKKTGTPMNMRMVFPPFIGMPDHHIALDILFKPKSRTSIIGFESALPNYRKLLEQMLKDEFTKAKVDVIANTIQVSNWDCAMYSLSNALKSFKHFNEYTGKLHNGKKKVDIPVEFLKHAHSKTFIQNVPKKDHIVTKEKTGPTSETLLHRTLAYRADRGNKAYSLSIEGFRLQEIARAGEYLAAHSEADGSISPSLA